MTLLERRAALLAGLSMIAMAFIAMPISAALTAHLDGQETWLSTTGVGAGFVAVAVLDLVVAWAMWGWLRRGAPVLAAVQAALRSTVGFVLGWASLSLLLDPSPSRQAAEAFQGRWEASLMFFGPALLAVAAAMAQARQAPRWVVAVTAAAGVGYLLDSFAPAVPTGVLLPFLLGELVLAFWLAWAGRSAFRTEPMT